MKKAGWHFYIDSPIDSVSDSACDFCYRIANINLWVFIKYLLNVHFCLSPGEDTGESGWKAKTSPSYVF